jgi:hypothetical protein
MHKHPACNTNREHHPMQQYQKINTPERKKYNNNRSLESKASLSVRSLLITNLSRMKKKAVIAKAIKMSSQ